MSETVAIDLQLEAICAYCETQPIERLSVLGAEFDRWLRPDTEIGMLAEYEPEAIITLIDMAGHEIDLGEIMGRAVSLHTVEGLRRGSLEKYINDARLIYAKNP